MNKEYALSIPDIYGIVRRVVKKGESRLSFEEFVRGYSRYYNEVYSEEVSGPLKITDDPHEFKDWVREIKEREGSGFFHLSCIDLTSCCLHYHLPGDDGKRFAALYDYQLED